METNRLCLILLLSISASWCRPNAETTFKSSASGCGYESCPAVKDGMLNVHIVPHTHDDVGWLKTVDQYYYGSAGHVAGGGVQFILDSVIPELLKDPSRRFIYVEIAFFARWWREQDDSMKHIVKGLVNEGRLEFILGGWCMNDEASTHYNAIIDQHSLGLQFLRVNFGECGRPRIAWQIDPFGHSREQASLFAQMGYDALYFGRLDYQDKEKRLKEKSMEMIWHGSPNNLGSASDLFTGALFNGYSPPGGFCWDIKCSDDPIMDDPRLHDYNVQNRVDAFVKTAKDQAKHFQTNHIIMTMGSDFEYMNAHTWYKNLDKLIRYVNEQQANNSINLIYSTPSCYTYQLNKAGKAWPTKDDDFFPYGDSGHSYWTGYFTSRAALKYYVRRTNNFLQIVKQMDALAKLEDTDNSTYNIEILQEAMGVAQHHDAVSGTEKQAVAYDYAERLSIGVDECKKVVNDAYTKLLARGEPIPPGQMFCDQLNITLCQAIESEKQFQVLIYNPLGRPIFYNVKVPVVGKSYNVVGPHGESVPAEVYPDSPDTARIPEKKAGLSTNYLAFSANLPALGFSVYQVALVAERIDRTAVKHKEITVPDEDIIIANEYISLSFDSTTGKLKSMSNFKKNIVIPLNQTFMYYKGYATDKGGDQNSGAYIFRPNGTMPIDIGKISIKRNSYYKNGQLIQEIFQEFSPWATQMVRIYANEQYAEFQWTIGPIPIKDKIGKEVITRYDTNLSTNKTFYTDANGREILQRVRDHRDTWTLNLTEPVASNYYPVNSRIFMRDTQRKIQFTVVNDRSEAGGSLIDGSLELLVHRRLLKDDGRGVGEPMNETGSDGKGLIVRGCHYIFLDTIDDSARLHRDLAEKLFMAPLVSFTNAKIDYNNWVLAFLTNWSGLKHALPSNVHLLTLEQFPGSGPVPTPMQPYLLRLEHFYEKNEDSVLSQPVTVSLQGLFAPFNIESVYDLTLGSNLQLSKLNRLKWQARDADFSQDNTLSFSSHFEVDPLNITLIPMQIKTFQVQLQV